MWIDFNNSFTYTFTEKLRKKRNKKTSPHLKSIAKLPCEI